MESLYRAYINCLNSLKLQEEGFSKLNGSLWADLVKKWEEVDNTPRQDKVTKSVISVHEARFKSCMFFLFCAMSSSLSLSLLTHFSPSHPKKGLWKTSSPGNTKQTCRFEDWVWIYTIHEHCTQAQTWTVSTLPNQLSMLRFWTFDFQSPHWENVSVTTNAKSKAKSPESLAIATACSKLQSDLIKLRGTQFSLFPALQSIITSVDPTFPEKESLHLPSSFSESFRAAYGLDKLGKIEYELREGRAHDALESIHTSIKTFNHNLDLKKAAVLLSCNATWRDDRWSLLGVEIWTRRI